MRPVASAANQPRIPATSDNAGVGRRDEERRQGEHEPDEDAEPPLPGRRRDREVDRVAPLAADEPGELTPDEVEERRHVRVLPDERREEAVEELRARGRARARAPTRAAAASTAGTVHSVSQKRCGIASSALKATRSRGRAEIVVHRDRDGMLRELGPRHDAAGRRIRVAVGQEQDVGERLAAVADRVGRRVAHSTRHASADHATRTTRATATVVAKPEDEPGAEDSPKALEPASAEVRSAPERRAPAESRARADPAAPVGRSRRRPDTPSLPRTADTGRRRGTGTRSDASST